MALLPLLFDRHAFVIAVGIPRVAGAALAAEIGSTVPAKQLRGQQVILLGLVAGRGFLVLCQPFLHPVKKVLGDDGGYALRYYNVPIGILPDVAAVVQKVLDAVIGQRLSPCVLHALLVQIVPDFLHGRTLGIPFEGFQYKRSGQRVKLEILLAVDGVPDGQGAAVVLGFEGVLRHAPDYLLGEIGGVVFGVPLQHALQNDALGPV